MNKVAFQGACIGLICGLSFVNATIHITAGDCFLYLSTTTLAGVLVGLAFSRANNPEFQSWLDEPARHYTRLKIKVLEELHDSSYNMLEVSGITNPYDKDGRMQFADEDAWELIGTCDNVAFRHKDHYLDDIRIDSCKAGSEFEIARAMNGLKLDYCMNGDTIEFMVVEHQPNPKDANPDCKYGLKCEKSKWHCLFCKSKVVD